MYSNMLSKVHVFEHNESMNKWNIRCLYKKSEVPKEKKWRQQVKNQKRKNILFLLFSLWGSEKSGIPSSSLECKKLGIYLKCDCYT